MELHFNVWLPYVHKDVSGLPDEVMEREKQELCVRVVDRGLSFFFLQTDVEIQCMTELSDKKKRALVHSSFLNKNGSLKSTSWSSTGNHLLTAFNLGHVPEQMHYFYLPILSSSYSSSNRSSATFKMPISPSRAYDTSNMHISNSMRSLRLRLTLGLHFKNAPHMLLID